MKKPAISDQLKDEKKSNESILININSWIIYIYISAYRVITPQSPLNPPEGDFQSFFYAFFIPLWGVGGLYLNHYMLVLF